MTDLRGKTGAELTALMHDDNEVVAEAVEMKVAADVLTALLWHSDHPSKLIGNQGQIAHADRCTGRVLGAKAAVSAMGKK